MSARQEFLDKVAAHRGSVVLLDAPVGFGRTAVDLLLPCTVGGKVALLVTEPVLISNYQHTYERLRAEGVAVSTLLFSDDTGYIVANAPVARLISKTELSRPLGARWLTDLRPDLVIYDDAHPKTAREYRIGEYVRNNNAVTVVRWETVEDRK